MSMSHQPPFLHSLYHLALPTCSVTVSENCSRRHLQNKEVNETDKEAALRDLFCRHRTKMRLPRTGNIQEKFCLGQWIIQTQAAPWQFWELSSACNKIKFTSKAVSLIFRPFPSFCSYLESFPPWKPLLVVIHPVQIGWLSPKFIWHLFILFI